MKRSLAITAVAAAIALGTAGTAAAAPLPVENTTAVATTDTGSAALTGSSEVAGMILLVPSFVATLVVCQLYSLSGQTPGLCIW
ncbi:hypothetical protein [Nocardia tengchongensis]|uniref:hypothetical protein n=1 Tax=Nocardia tengchongensis TaxID=2055889 RepID=UPI0036BB94C7